MRVIPSFFNGNCILLSRRTRWVPICDYQIDEEVGRGCSSDADCPPGYICVNGRCVPLGDGRQTTYGPVDYGDIEIVTGGGVPALTTRRCRVRTLADGTEEYYDCVDDFLTPIGTTNWLSFNRT